MNYEQDLTRDLRAEQAVLGAVFLDPACIDQVKTLEPRDFWLETHRLIFEVMLWLDSKDLPIDLVTVTEQFIKHGRANDSGGASYLYELYNSTPTAANVRYYATIVRSKAFRRRGEKVGSEIVDLSRQDFESDEEYFAAIEDKVDELRPKQMNKMRSFAEIRGKYFNHLEAKAEKLRTGWFPKFDSWASFWRGWLFTLAGRPGVGKTAKALLYAHGIAKHNSGAGPVLIWSQEMSEEEVIDRMVAAVAEVNYSRLINKGGQGGFTVDDWNKINAAYNEIEKLPLFVSDASGVTIDEIRATVKQFAKEHGKVAAVIVDYLQIMEINEKRGETRATAIGRVTKAAKNIARRFKLVFILLSQLDRAVDNEEPKMRHLKESGSIEQDSDVIELLWHNDKDQPDKNAKLIDSIFAKGRNVGLNRFRLEFKWWYQRFAETEWKVGDGDGGETGANNQRSGVRGGTGKTKGRS